MSRKPGRPRVLTDDERRERRRLKTAAWRLANLDRYREIVRESMRRKAAERALAEGRIPGKKGPIKKFTEEEKRAKRLAKASLYYARHTEKAREAAKLRMRAKRAGTFVSKARPRLTDEQRRLRDIAMAANRRARVRGAFGKHTLADILRLYDLQEGICTFCSKPLGDEWHVDHWLPLALGGSNDRLNLRLLHPACNLVKGARHPGEFRIEPTVLVW